MPTDALPSGRTLHAGFFYIDADTITRRRHPRHIHVNDTIGWSSPKRKRDAIVGDFWFLVVIFKSRCEALQFYAVITLTAFQVGLRGVSHGVYCIFQRRRARTQE